MNPSMPIERVLPESELRARVIERIKDGRLPVVLPIRINAGYGTGLPCDLCDRPVPAQKVEYEVIDQRTGTRLYFHVACHSVWQRECAERLRHTPSGPQQP